MLESDTISALVVVIAVMFGGGGVGCFVYIICADCVTGHSEFD
jgi:phage shock protein PspC (stress-responsive transcriptional regulator)